MTLHELDSDAKMTKQLYTMANELAFAWTFTPVFIIGMKPVYFGT